MRLLMNGRFLGRPPTGVDRTALELTRALAALRTIEGFDLTVAVPPGLAVAASKAVDGDVPVVAVGKDLPGHVWEQVHLAAAQPDAWLVSLCNTGPLLRRRQAVLVHDAQFRTQPASYSRAFRTAYSLLLPALSRRAELVFTVSAFSRSALEAENVAPAGKLEILPNGSDHLDRYEADDSVIRRLGLRAGGYFLAVGSVAPHKNLDTLYRAFASDQADGPPLVVVGGEDRRVHRGVGVGVAPRVQAAGRVTDEELKALYANALALCLPSLTEGFGLSAVEAMRCGTPVLAARAGALPDVCGGAAMLIEAMDVSAWRRALRRIECDPALRRTLSSAGRKRAQNFEWTSSAHLLIARIRDQGGVRPATSRPLGCSGHQE